ncbi:MAG: COX15/CtaA family protein [Candidatus Acidiferrales bacterium]
MATFPNRGVHRFALFVTASTVLLLVAGALVTSNDAGLSVPDWPLSYGSIWPPMIGGIFYEHGHRMVAAFVGILTICLVIGLYRRESRRWVRTLGLAAIGLILAQGLLGGLTVLFYLPRPISTAHATLAQLFFVTIVSLAVFTSDWWQREQPVLSDSGSPGIRALGIATSSVIVLQLIFGAAYRHHLTGVGPHIFGAALVTFMVVWFGVAVKRRFAQASVLRAWVKILHAFFGSQILLGVAALWAVIKNQAVPQPLLAMVALTVAHVAVGALTLAASVVLTLCCWRLVPGRRAHRVSSRAEERSAV